MSPSLANGHGWPLQCLCSGGLQVRRNDQRGWRSHWSHLYVRFRTIWPRLTLPGSVSATYNWTAIEAGVGLVCACFPVIAPIFRVKPPQQPYSYIKDIIGGHKSGSSGSSGKFIRSTPRRGRETDDSESIIHEMKPTFSHCQNCGHGAKFGVEIPSSPPAARVIDSCQERKKILRHEAGDPMVDNEVYYGLSSGNRGFNSGKSPPVMGI